MEKRELINNIKRFLKKEKEYNLLTIIVENIADKNYYFDVYFGEKDLEVKYGEYSIVDDALKLQEPKKIKFGRSSGTLYNMVLEIVCFDFMKGIPSYDKTNEKSFSLAIQDKYSIISFGKKCEDSKYNYIYNFINYLLSYLKIDDNDLFIIADDKNIINEALKLDRKIINFMKKYESGRDFSFEIKLNKEWKKTDFVKRCKNLCSRMNNIELIETIYKTEYVYEIGGCLENLQPVFIDFNYVREFQDALFGALFKCFKLRDLILETGFTDYFLEKIFEKTKVNETIDEILKMMSNEQIMYLANNVSGWNKIYYLKYLEKELKIEHKFEDYEFRDIDRKLVIVESMEEKFNNFGIEELKNPFIGYVYIDNKTGFNIRVIGNDNNKELIKKLCTKNCILIRNNMFKYYDIKLYDKELDIYNLDKKIEKGYYDNKFVKMREHKELDSLRNSLYPDDVEITVLLNGKTEILWGRLLDYDEVNKYYIIELLNRSYFDEKAESGTIVACTFKDKVLIMKYVLQF